MLGPRGVLWHGHPLVQLRYEVIWIIKQSDIDSMYNNTITICNCMNVGTSLEKAIKTGFVILLGCRHFGDWVTKMSKSSLLKYSVQLRTHYLSSISLKMPWHQWKWTINLSFNKKHLCSQQYKFNFWSKLNLLSFEKFKGSVQEKLGELQHIWKVKAKGIVFTPGRTLQFTNRNFESSP